MRRPCFDGGDRAIAQIDQRLVARRRIIELHQAFLSKWKLAARKYYRLIITDKHAAFNLFHVRARTEAARHAGHTGATLIQENTNEHDYCGPFSVAG
jgi:hypothetical protein